MDIADLTIIYMPNRSDQEPKYGTKLSQKEEASYQKWRAGLPKPLQYEGDYDLRGLYRSNPNVKPSANMHFPDTYKLPNHPTFSNESKYFTPLTRSRAGKWQETDSSFNYIPFNPAIKDTVVELKTQDKKWIMPINNKMAIGMGPLEEDAPPKGYKPLTIKQRADWNNFVRYLNRDLKIGGKKELDDRTKATGLALLAEYKKKNPDFSITPDLVPHVQYEFKHLKDSASLPGINPQGRVKDIVKGYFQDRDISPIDGWIGSLTSRQGYPEVTEFSDDPQKRYWGLDYEGASGYEKEVWDKKKNNKQQSRSAAMRPDTRANIDSVIRSAGMKNVMYGAQ